MVSAAICIVAGGQLTHQLQSTRPFVVIIRWLSLVCRDHSIVFVLFLIFSLGRMMHILCTCTPLDAESILSPIR